MSVVACPKCTEKVTLPAKTPPAAKVRCPLCSETYSLEEAMATMPPMLEVLELPEGYQPETEVDISTAAFLKTADRPAMMDDDLGELKLEGQEAGVAVADDELKPTYDEWGPTRSTEPAYEIESSPITPRELVQSPVRKRKKQINPLFHIIGIVGGGVVAIPVALLILLWLPGSLRRDPLQIGNQIGEYAPFLVPADFRPTDSGDSEDETSNSDSTPAVANKNQAEASKRGAGGPGGRLGGDVEPMGKSGLQGDEFENALKEGGFSLDNDSSTRPERNEPDSAKTESAETESTGTESAETQPKIDNPLEFKSVIDDSVELTPDKPQPKGEPEPESKPEPAPSPEPEADATTEPEPEPAPEPAIEVDPEVNFNLPERSKPSDPLSAQKLAVNSANAEFGKAATAAERKAAAIKLYHAAAELAEQLPRDAAMPAEMELLTSDAKKLQFVGLYAATWQENIERATPGILLSGTVKECRPAGERFDVRIELPSRDKRELLVITDDECQPGQKLLIAGRFVMNARDMISGYTGDAGMAIDARLLKVVE